VPEFFLFCREVGVTFWRLVVGVSAMSFALFSLVA